MMTKLPRREWSRLAGLGSLGLALGLWPDQTITKTQALAQPCGVSARVEGIADYLKALRKMNGGRCCGEMFIDYGHEPVVASIESRSIEGDDLPIVQVGDYVMVYDGVTMVAEGTVRCSTPTRMEIESSFRVRPRRMEDA